ncbi:Deoxyribonuclease tatD-like protein [Leptotrombidium deliense]|uniref:Deoxyribonuclease TATDN1 n=1 Tax=Leptotrombidium deliense TaxID=299467 RepID=A0A443S9M2_9ACAR|nr:Deoxyribonuclease tatD-like protein [Leptotrombidium deliense]
MRKYDTISKTKSKVKTLTQEQIIAGFNQLRQEQRNLASKVVELEADLNEHSLVIDALKNVDTNRRCYRMIGGILVERNVGEVLPSLNDNKEAISKLVDSLKNQIVGKGKEINEYMEKHNIQIKQEPAANNETVKQQEESLEKLSQKLGIEEGRYFIVDIGANLTNKKYSRDLDAVIQRAHDSVQKIMVTGTSIHNSKEALRLTRLYPGSLYCTAGIHPHDAKSWNDESYDALKEIAENAECVAIGECGLDFNRNFSPVESQLEAFEKQVQLACEIRKPLFIHERDAHEQLINILAKYVDSLPVTVIHCFTGTVNEAQKYIELGFYIGLTGFLWKDKSENGVRKILEQRVIPVNRLLLETDSPFMYPNTRASKLPENVKTSLTQRSLSFLHRYCTFQRNEPCSLPVTVEMIAAYLDMKPEDIALKTSFNALHVFGLNK